MGGYPPFDELIAAWHVAGGVHHDRIEVGRAESAEYRAWRDGTGSETEYWEWKLKPVDAQHHLRAIGTGIDGAIVEWPPADENVAMEFTAKVSSRSSHDPRGPPGEAEVLKRTPQRRLKILEVTGWTEVVPRTLDLEVAPGIVDQLLSLSPVIEEAAASVVYGPPYQDIPRKGGGYLYYAATISRSGISAPTLIRRPVELQLPQRVEAFSDRYLHDFLRVDDGDKVFCRMGAPWGLRAPLRRARRSRAIRNG